MDLALITLASYASAAFIYCLLLILLLVSWRGRLQGGLLLIAVILTIISNSGNALHSLAVLANVNFVFALETLKQAAWALFLLRLLTLRSDPSNQHSRWLTTFSIPVTLIGFALLASYLVAVSVPSFPSPAEQRPPVAPLLAGSVFLIWLIEQLYRNSSASQRWAIKYLCIGLGGSTTFDLVLLIDAMLFNQISPGAWAARGFVQALAVPLIAVSATRNPDWEVKVFVSRSVVFFSGSLIAIGGYLILVALAGYFLKVFGGDWGETLRATLIFAALIGLLVVASSVQMRGQVKQFIARHFYQNKYEYRDEWLLLTQRLSEPSEFSPHQVALSAIRELLESPRGALWSPDRSARWRQTCRWEWPTDDEVVTLNAKAMETLQNQATIINLTTQADPSHLTHLPRALSRGAQPWLLIPIINQGKLEALVQLGESPSLPPQLDWEDIALVKAVSHQIAAYLAFHNLIDELAEARQFEAYNRLSAFLVHDLKNVVAQLQLVVQNSRKHADNPEFIKDAFATVGNAVEKMNAILQQLRDRNASPDSSSVGSVELKDLLEEVVRQRGNHHPVPQLRITAKTPQAIRCNRERLLNVLLHLVQNAQEATDKSGEVIISTTDEGILCAIEIADTGCGMSEEFLRNHLFKPFKTTKGNAGMGIGVYESKEYIESLGGTIDVSSTVGTGTRFTIKMPTLSTDSVSLSDEGTRHE